MQNNTEQRIYCWILLRFREKQAELERKAEIKAIEKQVKEMQVNNEREYRKALANDAFNLWLDIKVIFQQQQ